ncbi:MAG: metallophosphoesterase family protein [Desulfosarcina sp.]
MTIDLKTAIISDIHGNMQALERVWIDIEQNDVDTVVCLGDMVGYGPEPEAVVNFIIQQGIRAIAGNHELAVIDAGRLSEMSPDARASILITRQLISAATRKYIDRLPRWLTQDDLYFVHGLPPDATSEYLTYVGANEVVTRMNSVDQQLIFVGHTHRPVICSYDGKRLNTAVPAAGRTKLCKNRTYIVNVGSVGQPRDGDARAKYMIMDTVAGTVELRCVAYDIHKTVDRIAALGFPANNGQRLFGYE